MFKNLTLNIEQKQRIQAALRHGGAQVVLYLDKFTECALPWRPEQLVTINNV